MATKTFCDTCGDEAPVKRTQLMAEGVSIKDLGDTCDGCRVSAADALIAWREERIKTKKQSIVVDAEMVDTVDALNAGKAQVVAK